MNIALVLLVHQDIIAQVLQFSLLDAEEDIIVQLVRLHVLNVQLVMLVQMVNPLQLHALQDFILLQDQGIIN